MIRESIDERNRNRRKRGQLELTQAEVEAHDRALAGRRALLRFVDELEALFNRYRVILHQFDGDYGLIEHSGDPADVGYLRKDLQRDYDQDSGIRERFEAFAAKN